MLVVGDVLASESEIERRICLVIFAVAISQLTDKMRFVTSLGPRFPKVQADRSRRSSDLTGQSISFLGRESLGEFEDLHRQLKSDFVNLQLLCGFNFHILVLASVICPPSSISVRRVQVGTRRTVLPPLRASPPSSSATRTPSPAARDDADLARQGSPVRDATIRLVPGRILRVRERHRCHCAPDLPANKRRHGRTVAGLRWHFG